MSYVIHNFYNLQSPVTPKLKYAITAQNFEKFFMWTKMQLFLKNWYASQNTIFYFNISPLTHLFYKNILTYFYKNDLSWKTNYTSNYYKSLICYNLNMFNIFLGKGDVAPTVITIENEILSNQYFLPIKTINFVINKKFYENFFFMFAFLDNNLWNGYSVFFKPYLNFWLIDFKFQQYIFYNGFFCNIYNF